MSDLNINTLITNTTIQNAKNKTSDLKRKLENADTSKDNKELMKACQEFETIFTNMLLKQMRATVQDGGLTEKSTARKIFEEMYDEEISKSISEKGQGIGIAKTLYEQMKNKI